MRTKDKASLSCLEEITRSVIVASASNHAMASWNMSGIRKL
jgi:hypothetical protein